ncbi:MAG: carbohydrate kinase family protein [Candidatus Berkelbacteria bacterium]|nr:carbohydrate kinase family protein [Candidatus Berkelbacteria bacterium]
MKKVYCVGEAMRDTVLRVSESKIVNEEEKKLLCFNFGDKIAVDELKHFCGGSALNVSFGLKKFGLEPAIISTLGEDSEGGRVLETLGSGGIDTSLIIKSGDFSTKAAFILNTPEGDRTILVYHGKGVLASDLVDWDKIEEGAMIYLGPLPENTQEFIDKVLEIKEKKNLSLVVNPGAIQISWPAPENKKVIEKADLYVLNKDEAMTIFPTIEGEKELLQKFIETGAKKIIITKGEEGSIASDGENFFKLGIVHVKTLDMTGAGDAFLSAVVGSIARDMPFHESLFAGAINSASVVEKYGAQEGLLGPDDIKTRTAEAALQTESL